VRSPGGPLHLAPPFLQDVIVISIFFNSNNNMDAHSGCIALIHNLPRRACERKVNTLGNRFVGLLSFRTLPTANPQVWNIVGAQTEDLTKAVNLLVAKRFESSEVEGFRFFDI
jgi:hypothetical protein